MLNFVLAATKRLYFPSSCN